MVAKPAKIGNINIKNKQVALYVENKDGNRYA